MTFIHSIQWLLSSEGILHVVNVWGIVGICAVIFAETGIFPLLPGDSLLVVAGLVAATQTPAGVPAGVPVLNVWGLLLLVPLCAIIGDQFGYTAGRIIGWAIFDWKEKRFGPIPIYKPEWLKATTAFFERWGAFAIVACRWVPIVRTFAPILAGASKMRYRSFIPYNIIGAFSWVWTMVGLGYGLKVGLQVVVERFVPGFEVAKHIDAIALVIIFLSILPLLYSFFKGRQAGKKLKTKKVSSSEKSKQVKRVMSKTRKNK